MNRYPRRQRGAILIMALIAIVVLIGIAALALDLGRLFVQKTELQNAADAAALAAAAELDGDENAQDRAKAAARQLLSTDQYNRGIFFGEFTWDDDLPDTAFKFYSSIKPEPKVSTTDDSNTRFVEVTIDLTEAKEAEGEMVPLFFLPVLNLLPGVAPIEEGTRAVALAGVENVPCYEPALFMCVDDKTDLPVEEGEMVWLRQHGGKGSAWTAGNFGFLLPSTSKTGAPQLQTQLAKAGNEECVSGSQYVARTGQVAQKSKQGVNTRFDIYEAGLDDDDYPPAPNIITYPKDTVFITNPAPPGADSFRVGDGVWDSEDYFNTYHSTVAIADRPDDWNTDITRWETYLWELDLEGDLEPQGNPHMPVHKDKWDLDTPPDGPPVTECDPTTTDDSDPLGDCHGAPRPAHFHCAAGDTDCISNLYDAIYPSDDPDVPYGGTPPSHTSPDGDVATDATRRVMYVAALECEALGLTGAFDEEDVDVLRDGEILQFLLTKYATHPGGDPNKFEIYGEYIGPTEEGSGLTRRIIQLYE